MTERTAGAPKASVVVPVFDTEAYLDECLGSLVSQTLRDIEIVCVDDGSTDGSPAKLAEWAERDSRVRVIRQENRGGGAARNAGMDAATGEWLFFCDSDDACEPEMLEEMIRAGDGTDAQVVVAPRAIWDETLRTIVSVTRLPARVLRPESSFSGTDLGAKVFTFSGNTAWNKLFRRSFVTENRIRNAELSKSGDLPFVNLSMALAARISAVGTSRYRYRSNRRGSAVLSFEKNPLGIYDCFDFLKRELESRKRFPEFTKAYSFNLFVTAVYQMCGFRRRESVAVSHARLRKTLLELRSSCDLAANGVLDEIQQDAYRTLLESADSVPFLLSCWRGAVQRGNALRARTSELEDNWQKESEMRKRTETALETARNELEKERAGHETKMESARQSAEQAISAERARFERSLSWRLTAPFRFPVRLANRLSGREPK